MPRCELPCIVGRPKLPKLFQLFEEKDVFVCNDAHVKREVLELSFPIENGLITNFEDMEKIWHHAFYSKLRVAPETQPVLLTDAPLNPKAS